MRTFKLTLEYDGSRYHGWQDQLNARTVQGELKQAAADVTHGIVDVQGAGRTDSGVHALGQVAHLKTRSRSQSPAELMKALNDKLPADIAILAAEEVHLNFHARHDASTRAYLYQITTRKTAFAKKYVWWIKEPLNVEAMSRAASTLVGRHDFALFAQRDPSKPGESTIVVVEKASVEMDEHLVLFRIEASHFLWKMVRRVTGALAKVGLGEWTEADFAALLAGKASPRLDVGASTAPASGLFLESVAYDERPSGSRPKSQALREDSGPPRPQPQREDSRPPRPQPQREDSGPPRPQPRREDSRPPRPQPQREGFRPARPQPRREDSRPPRPQPQREDSRPPRPQPQREGFRPARPQPQREDSRPPRPQPQREGSRPPRPQPRREDSRPPSPRDRDAQREKRPPRPRR